MGSITADAQIREASGDSGWRYSAGVNWRSIGNMDTKTEDLTPGDSNFVNGSVVDVGAGNFSYTVANSVLQVDNATLDKIEYQKASIVGGNSDLDDSYGIALIATQEIGTTDHFIVELGLSLTTTFIGDGISTLASTQAFQYDIAPNTWPNANAPNPGGGPDPDVTQAIFAVSNQSQIIAATNPVTTTIDYDLDLDLYTFGYGWNLMYSAEGLKLRIGAGPTLTLIDYDVSRSVAAAFAGSTAFFNTEVEDDDLALRAGVYAAIGVDCRLGDDWGIGIAGRYDLVASDVHSDIADIDLDGFSGQLFLNFSF